MLGLSSTEGARRGVHVTKLVLQAFVTRRRANQLAHIDQQYAPRRKQNGGAGRQPPTPLLPAGVLLINLHSLISPTSNNERLETVEPRRAIIKRHYGVILLVSPKLLLRGASRRPGAPF